MHTPSEIGHALSADLLILILDNVAGDSTTLARCGLVCRTWRALSLPLLLHDVDLSCHNNGRLPEHEDGKFPLDYGVVMADYSDEYRPENLVSRQRAFLRLLVDRPELALHVKAFTWTLVWKDFEEDTLADIDLRAWEVFECMKNVARLDLASLHDIGDEPYIRQNPSELFPATTHLRLVGWMHRGLVKAILSSLDSKKLQSLELDHLQEEGTLPDGEPMPQDMATEHTPERGNPYKDAGVDEVLFARQEKGETGIFPGPMWFPLRLLRQKSLPSLTSLYVRLGTMISAVNERDAITMFRETANFVRSTSQTLKTLVVELGESPSLFVNEEDLGNVCGTYRSQLRMMGKRLGYDFVTAFLHQLLPALTDEAYPNLTTVELKGFRSVRDGRSRLRDPPSPDLTWQYIRACPFVDEEFTKVANLDYRKPFTGYDYYLVDKSQEELDELQAVLSRS